MKNIVVYGIGGFGREVMESLAQENQVSGRYKILGFVDDDESKVGTKVNGHLVIGTGAYLCDCKDPICVLLGIGTPRVREKIVSKLRVNPQVEFPNFIAQGAILNQEFVEMGQGNLIMAQNVFTVNITMGDFNIVNLQCSVGHDVVIRDYVTVAPGCNISGDVRIESGCDIGTGSAIRQGLTIGSKTVIGMGSVVVKDIPEMVVAYGNPCIVR